MGIGYTKISFSFSVLKFSLVGASSTFFATLIYNVHVDEEEELMKIELDIANMCEESNKRRVNENFKSIGGTNGDLLH